MRRYIVTALVSFGMLAACSIDKTRFSKPSDAGTNQDATADACSVLLQTGCDAGEKCGWYQDDPTQPSTGQIGCAPDGTVGIGGACVYGEPGATGYDDCVGGGVCVRGTCEAICDPDGASTCPANFGCVRIEGLFGAVVGAAPSGAGVCEGSCDPLADNDFDGPGGPDIKTGSACPTETDGCYFAGFGNSVCANPAPGSELLAHREEVVGQAFANSCHPGYTIAFSQDATGSNTTRCYSFCAPSNTYGSSPTTPPPQFQEPNGLSPNSCRSGDRGRTGDWSGGIPNGIPGSLEMPAGTNGEHCMYLWLVQIDAAGMLTRSPFSDTVGICFDHTKYGPDDYDADPNTPPTTMPACSNLRLDDPMQLDAADLGCVDSVTAGIPVAAVGKSVKRPVKNKAFKIDLMFPMLNPDFDLPFSPR